MKYTFKKIGAALLGLTLAITSLTGCGAKNAAQDTQAPNSTESVVYRTVDEIKESGTINIGVFSDKSPFGYVDENGEYQGYDNAAAPRPPDQSLDIRRCARYSAVGPIAYGSTLNPGLCSAGPLPVPAFR